MKQILTKSVGQLVFQEVPTPVAGENQALIEVKSIGICNSDIAPYQGRILDLIPLPFVMGHEFGGEVKEINGSSDEFKVGDNVAVYPQLNCGSCYYCTHDIERMCESQTMFGSPKKEGGMAEFAAVPLKNLVKLGSSFNVSYAGLVEPATVAYRAVKGFKNINVAVIGVGAIGSMMGQVLKHNKCRFIAMDIDDAALRYILDLGADLAVNLNDSQRSGEINGFLGEDKLDAVVIGFLNKENWDFAMEIVRKEGTIVEMAEPKKFEVDFKPILFKSPIIRGSACYNFDEFKKAAELIEQGIIDAEKIVTKTFPFDKAKEAFEYKANNPVLKVIITN